MRGIAFIGGHSPRAEQCRALAAQADLIVAADSGLIAAERASVKPDWILGDMDSLDEPQRLDKYSAERIIRYPPDKDYTDTELALTFLWEKGCDETWLIGGGGGRIDHLFAIRSLFERRQSPDRWFTGAEDIYCLKSTYILSLSLAPMSVVSLFPLGEGPWKAQSQGLKWSLDELRWDQGFFGISNIAPTGVFSVLSKTGRFFVIIPKREP